MPSKKKKRRGNGAHTNHSHGLQFYFSKYWKNPVIAVVIIAIIFMSLLFLFLGRATNVNNVNSCVSNCTFNN